MTVPPRVARRDVDELIHRALRDELRGDDAEWLAEWRRESLANEQHYRRAVRLMSAMRSEADIPARQAPSVQSLLARDRGESYSSTRRWSPARPVTMLITAASIVVVLGSAGFIAHRRAVTALTRKLSSPAADTEYASTPSSSATVRLADGSTAQLWPNSHLRFTDGSTLRQATLDGHAVFFVAAHPDRPFVVRTRFGEAKVLGSRFEVAADSGELRVRVLSSQP